MADTPAPATPLGPAPAPSSGWGMATLEIWDSRGRDYRTLEASAYLVGSAAEVDITIDDATVSGVHLVLERAGAVWLVRDLGSRNGTLVNGQRLVAQQRLRHGDEIVAGRTKLVFLDRAADRAPRTQPIAPLPELTKGEHRVLVELCRPLLSGNAFTPPASDREIAERLYVGVGAIKAHLGHLYDKFGIGQDPAEPRGRRRVRLANEAVQRGAVTARDLETA